MTALVGLLNEPVGTRLHRRLEQEGRILNVVTGDNTAFSINFSPKMNADTLVNGYSRILGTIYASKHYYARVKKFLQEYQLPRAKRSRLKFMHVRAMAQSIVRLGIIGSERYQYLEALLLVPGPEAAALPARHHPLDLRLPLPPGLPAAREAAPGVRCPSADRSQETEQTAGDPGRSLRVQSRRSSFTAARSRKPGSPSPS